MYSGRKLAGKTTLPDIKYEYLKGDMTIYTLQLHWPTANASNSAVPTASTC